MSQRRTLLSLVVLVAVAAFGCSNQSPTSPQSEFGGVGFSSEAKLDKVDVCHITGNGSYVLININGNALPAHLDHGDSLPGENGLDANCESGGTPSDFVTFLSFTAVIPSGEWVDLEWTVEGTSDPVTYTVQGRYTGDVDWNPILGEDVIVGTGQGTYSTMDFWPWDEFQVIAEDGNGNQVISPIASPYY